MVAYVYVATVAAISECCVIYPTRRLECSSLVASVGHEWDDLLENRAVPVVMAVLAEWLWAMAMLTDVWTVLRVGDYARCHLLTSFFAI